LNTIYPTDGFAPNEVASGAPRLTIRRPVAEDAADIWRMAQRSTHLDTNSAYAYLLLCTDFAASGAVALGRGGVVGFTLGYRPPEDPESLFVWQIGVEPAARGRRVASLLLDTVARRERARGMRFLRATVTPSNAASRRLFRAFATRHRAEWDESLALPSALFPDGDHEDEIAIRIGPLAPPCPSETTRELES
jgi:L-2,4-diaminobutyric acid acetyltransferase